jgi:hypothetical protein
VNPFLFLPGEGIAGATILDKCVGMIRAGSPVAAGGDEILFGNKETAIAALELFVINLVIAGFSE